MSYFTNGQIEGMSDDELNDRIASAVGHHDAYSPSNSLMPWYLDPWAWPRRRQINDLLGNPPRPWPPTYCSVAANCQAAFTTAGLTYNGGLSARGNAENLLKHYNDTEN